MNGARGPRYTGGLPDKKTPSPDGPRGPRARRGKAHAPGEAPLRQLVALLDDEDPRGLEAVREEILRVGTAAVPFLEELRLASPGVPLARRAAELCEELRYRSLRAELASLARSSVPDLETGAFLISRFGHPGADPAVYRAWLDRTALEIGEDVTDADDPERAARKLSAHLFKRLGFSGNTSAYYDPDNSYLTRVIDTRRGIPVSLGTLVILLARRLRLPFHGVGAPGHFLVGLRSGGRPLFLDAFRGGRLLGEAEARRMLARQGQPDGPEALRPVSPREILARTLRNLVALHRRSGSAARAERLAELLEIVSSRGTAGGAA